MNLNVSSWLDRFAVILKNQVVVVSVNLFL